MMHQLKSTSKFVIFFVLMLIFPGFTGACRNQPLKTDNTAAVKTPENKAAGFENDLQTMKTANFDYIFVFRRKDGGVLDGADKTYLKANSPAVTNRFILSDDDKAVIAGSGYEFSAENLAALRKRFNVEDYSTPKQLKQAQINDGGNVNGSSK